MTTLEVIAEAPPLRRDEDGVIRVGETRVRFETVIIAFQNGCTPETIQDKYPALLLPDVYAVITYYLRHREEADLYLAERRLQAEESEREIETRFPSAGIRERLLARRVAQS